MMKHFLVLLILPILVYGKKDFFYGFVDKNLAPITQKEKKEILDVNNRLEAIKRYVRDGELETALQLITILKAGNKVKILESEIILLQCEILYKLKAKPKVVKADQILEEAINNSKIDRNDLLKAYRLLVMIKIRINKLKDAMYYANQISVIFDNPSFNVYGKVAKAQIYMKKRDYRRAIRILRRELIETTDLEVATIVADVLYDAYILNKQYEDGYNLVTKVLEKNIAFYVNDPYKAMEKIKKLEKANMYDLAIKILKALIEKAKKDENLKSYYDFRFRLANAYMDIAGFQPKYMPMAKEIYIELIQKKSNNPYKKEAKMYLDEILLREGKFDPQLIVTKYSGSDAMQNKALMQELLNALHKEQYKMIIRMKKIYKNIDPKIVHRFGYHSIDEVYELVHFKMLKYYLSTNQCSDLYNVMKDVSEDTLLSLVKDTKSIDNLFNCILETPEQKTYNIAKKVYRSSKNSRIYLYLERVALKLKKYKDALGYSQKLDMLKDADVLSDEFLYRFLLYGYMNKDYSMEKFFSYARKNKEYIVNNEQNPMIIDFYYQYYLYLLKINEEAEAIAILHKLYDKQIEMDARVYSPFVEIELAKWAKLDDDYKKALEYLKFGLNIKREVNGRVIQRKINKTYLAQIYYEMGKIYEYFGEKNRYKAVIKRCKKLKNVKSYYKKMCDNL